MGTAENGLATQATFVGVCTLEPPPKPWLVVQVGEEIATIYRLGMVGGRAAVILQPSQSPEHLPGFMTAAECSVAFQAMTQHR